MGGHVPQNLEWGTPVYNVPQILTFSLYFSLTYSVSERYFI